MNNLMDGVTILNQVPNTNKTILLMLSIILTIVGIAVIIKGILIKIKDKSIVGIVIALLGILVLAIVYVFLFRFYQKDEKIYKVTVSDSVKYNEFTDKFNVINKDGNTLTISLKENK